MENSPLNNHAYRCRRILLLGTTGTGKTELACRTIDLHPAELVLIYDWQGGEFSERLGVPVAESREEFATMIDRGYRVVCYNAELGEADCMGAGYEWFCDFVMELCGTLPGRKLVVTDELQDLISPYKIPEATKRLLVRGRRRMIDTLMVGSQANALNNLGRNQVSELVCFRTIDEKALEYPRSLGMDTDRIKALPDCSFIHQDLRTGEKNELALWAKKTNGND